MGLDAQQMLQNDPDYLARQLARKEIQQYQNFQNPQLGLAATGGALLGRGIANLFGGRGFFDVSDPALRKVSEVQSLYNEAMQSFDPNNPGQSYAQLATTLAQRGYGREAALAAAEANKFTTQATELGLRQQEVEARMAALSADEARRRAEAEKTSSQITNVGVTRQGLATYRKGTDPTIYVVDEKGDEVKYDPKKHGTYETAADRRTPAAPPKPAAPKTITDRFGNVYQVNPDGTTKLLIPGLITPGQTPAPKPGAAPTTPSSSSRLRYEPGKGLVGGNK
jgi:hypothetical protein